MRALLAPHKVAGIMAAMERGEGATGGASEPLRVALTLDLDSEPITGQLHAETGEQESFTGWLALAAALEAARRRGRSAEDEGRP